MKKRGIALWMAGTLMLAGPVSVYADSAETYVSLGADLDQKERSKVLELLDLTEKDLENYVTVTVTNAEEHEYLDSYLSDSVIGSRALSSVLVEKKGKGNGIQVETKNITYCTSGMYENALATAGIQDADITVAGPFNISGTAALVGAIKAYEKMTGTEVEGKAVDTATNELVVTGQVAESLGDQEKAEQLVGAVKEQVVEGEAASAEQIEEVVNQAAQEMNVELSQEDRQAIVELMDKIDDLDLDIDSLKEQAKNLYDKIEDLGLKLDINEEQVKGFFQKIIDFFKDLFS